MTISFVGSSSALSNSASSSVTATLPAGVANGDLLIMSLGTCDAASPGTVSGPNVTSGLADWTSALNTNNTTNSRHRARVYYTIYDSATTTFTATLSAAGLWIADICAYRDSGGIGVSNPQGTTATTMGTTIASPAQSPVTSGVDWVWTRFQTVPSSTRTWTEGTATERNEDNAGSGSIFLSLATADSAAGVSSSTSYTGTHSGGNTTARIAQSLVITGTAGGPDVTGTLGATTGHVTSSISGVVKNNGVLGATTGHATASLTGQQLAPPEGELAVIAPSAGASFSGAVVLPITGSLAAMAPSAGASFSGQIPVLGQLGATTGGAQADFEGTGGPEVENLVRSGWYDLLAIMKNSRQTEQQYAQMWRARPLCCPNDGTALQEGHDGVLFCPWDGWRNTGVEH